jgi:hypothetical protein
MFTRISASCAPDQAISAFAGGASAHTILSPPAVQHALLSCLTTPAALPLRATCRDARAAVAGHAWEDRDTVIRGSIGAWRRCFPRALCANVSEATGHRRTPVVDEDLAHLKGLLELNLEGCRGITGAGIEHLRGIHTLNLGYCMGVTDAALAHLAGIHTLDIRWCKSITGAAFEHLRGIRSLKMRYNSSITDAAVEHLQGIHTLDMSFCTGITGAALEYLRSIHTLDMCGCTGITGAALEHLAGIQSLDMRGLYSPKWWYAGAGFVYLRGIRSLSLDSKLRAQAVAFGLPVN